MLRVFISSTVEDFGPVREELRARLQSRHIEVRLSESVDFPVEPGLTSHDACLAAVKGIDVFVLLIGQRFGGKYPGTDKSITWAEWEAAQESGAILVPLIERRANATARAIFNRRRELGTEHRGETVEQLDARLRREFPDSKPIVDNMPGVQRFIDAVRKGHVDNWVHEWSGTTDNALGILDARLGTALSSYHRERAGARELAQRGVSTAAALCDVSDAAALLASEVREKRLPADDAAQRLLEVCEDQRGPLLGFEEGDLYNLMLYRRVGEELVAGPRVSHAAVVRRNRKWKVGEGHVGLSVQHNSLLVSGDLRGTDAWRPTPESARSDAALYVSAITLPLYSSGDPHRPDGVFIVTSNRLRQFRDPDQLEVLTAKTLGRIITSVWI